jgi:hypothetical protein
MKENKIYELLIDNGALPLGPKSIAVGGCGITFSTNHKTGAFVLDIITTPSEMRRQGEGTKVMNILTRMSDLTNTPIELIVAPIERSNHSLSYFTRKDIVGNMASQTKNKIPVNKLKDWYLKFGFVANGFEGKRQKMIYTPKNN